MINGVWYAPVGDDIVTRHGATGTTRCVISAAAAGRAVLDIHSALGGLVVHGTGARPAACMRLV